jgi:hypothetical protein
LIAVIVPIVLLQVKGEQGAWTVGGTVWSFAAGVAGAVGALGVILALTNGGSPIYVMPLVFGCAPVINTFVTMGMTKTHREAKSMFYAGLILVIVGAVTVLIFNPTIRAKPDAESAAGSVIAHLPLVLVFVALAALCWGSYGPVLHKGQSLMNGSRTRPFMCVGLAYFVVAVILPTLWLLAGGSSGEKATFTIPGAAWSIAGGSAGALGALGIILAFTFGGKPVYVMPLVFGGAPVINTLISIFSAKDIKEVSPFFYAGLIVVAAGAVTVLIFAPKGKPHAEPPKPQSPPKVEPAKA